ncbi:MAG TPA: substrate-binding domain-containing protein [Streptosporangiaceae bacterium]|nr:substrate-binding domain-containing protein [Streptosporangiaceae bacterium]
MSDIDPKVDEAIETLNMKDGPTRRRLLSGVGLVSASAAAAGLLAACSSSSTSAAAKSTAGNFPSTPKWQFWFVNHVTTNPFFVPTQYGFQDASALLGLPTPKWGGSANSVVPEMVSYMNTAAAAKAAGIATTVVNSTGFTTPVGAAMNAGIPVITYNADGLYKPGGVPDIGTNRLCYVGQALYNSGYQMGLKIVSLVPSGDVVIFIATPGTGNIQPRYDGAAAAIKASGKPITLHEIATGAATGVELNAEKAYLNGHKTVKGAFAVDAGSTGFLASALSGTGLAGKIPAGGFDTLTDTLAGIKSGVVNFTIDQSPYLQGFLPVIYLYMYNLSGGLVYPPNTDTGLTFVTKSNVGLYPTPSRFEGSSAAQKYIPRPSGPITNPIATTST